MAAMEQWQRGQQRDLVAAARRQRDHRREIRRAYAYAIAGALLALAVAVLVLANHGGI